MRPDGRISTPLLEDVVAANKTPAELAREIEQQLSAFVADPLVTVIVTDFVGPLTQQVRVVGEATEPQAIPFRDDMTMLDVMIAVGGLTSSPPAIARLWCAPPPGRRRSTACASTIWCAMATSRPTSRCARATW